MTNPLEIVAYIIVAMGLTPMVGVVGVIVGDKIEHWRWRERQTK